MAESYDIFIIGGGINGCGIARDATGRGFRVGLAEMSDLASGTSSWSTKLVHGGLRYLEHYEFRLVREALKERDVLWRNAPHIIEPMRFVLPHHTGLRPQWLIRMGLFLYDHIAGRHRFGNARRLDLRSDAAGKPLKDEFVSAFEYGDARVDDARLVVLNAMDAKARGADISTRTQVVAAHRDAERGGWSITLTDTRDNAQRTVFARVLVNAAGPWVSRVTDMLAPADRGDDPAGVRLVRGSHIVVDQVFDHDRAYIFQNEDDRIAFAIPYCDNTTLIGTTDVDHDDPSSVEISDAEIEYLIEAANDYFKTPLAREMIRWTYSGVRPLYDDGATMAQEATRDYVLKTSGDEERGGLINIFGGKITTYRRLAESVMDEAQSLLGRDQDAWTIDAPLPGGEGGVEAHAELASELKRHYAFLPASVAERMTKSYGMRAHTLLGDAVSLADLGDDFGAGLTVREVEYLMTHEWAQTADDVVWRRSKLGLAMSAEEIAALEVWMIAHRQSEASSAA